VAYLCFQGEPLGFENKDSFYKELNEEQRSNGASREQTEARGGTTVLQGQKGGTAVPPTVQWRTAVPHREFAI